MIKINKFNVNVKVSVYKDNLGFLGIDIYHTKERYRYVSEVAMSGGDPYFIAINVVDTEQDNDGYILIEFPKEFSKYYERAGIYETRDKETEFFILIPWGRLETRLEIDVNHCKSKEQCHGIE